MGNRLSVKVFKRAKIRNINLCALLIDEDVVYRNAFLLPAINPTMIKPYIRAIEVRSIGLKYICTPILSFSR